MLVALSSTLVVGEGEHAVLKASPCLYIREAAGKWLKRY